MTSLRRVASGASFLAALPFTNPAAARSLARSLGSAVLDRRFEESSPIPPLPARCQEALDRESVRLPPAAMLEPGNQDFEGLKQLVALARALGTRRVFEIGTYNGVTALTLARNLPDAEVHTLDLAPEEEPALPLFEADSLNFRGTEARAYDGCPESERIVQHLGDSASFEFGPFAGTIDLVYVDGAHSYEYVHNDTRAAFDLVSAHGAVVWDDYWRLVPDVPRFLHELSSRALARIPGTRLVVWLAAGSALARTAAVIGV